MIKDKSYNPAQAARKAEKAKAIRKSKAEVAARRNEKLSRRNPDRLQGQLDELKAIETKGGTLTNHERKLVDQLEKDVRAIRKARDAKGIPAARPRPDECARPRHPDRPDASTLGKRPREQPQPQPPLQVDDTDDEDVPDDVKNIPMPRDTPPPIPRGILNAWYARHLGYLPPTRASPPPRHGGAAAPAEVKMVYEAKPQLRNLQKEATAARFMPAAVREKMGRLKGTQGKLLEPEEADQLEQEGYLAKARAATTATKSAPVAAAGASVSTAQMNEDEERLERELQEFSRNVAMEEVEDEDG